MSNSPQPLPVVIEIDRQRICDLLIIAIEQGIHYWTREVRLEDTNGREPGSYLGCKIVVVEAGDTPAEDVEHLTTINLSQVQEGLSQMAKIAPRHFGNFMAGDDDAETADVFMQVMLLGEIRYG